jgi:hypothetical protein
MPIGDGKTIAPTGKRFAIGMATIGHWKGKTMNHEWLFWDNQDFMKQLGLGNQARQTAHACEAGFARLVLESQSGRNSRVLQNVAHQFQPHHRVVQRHQPLL